MKHHPSLVAGMVSCLMILLPAAASARLSPEQVFGGQAPAAQSLSSSNPSSPVNSSQQSSAQTPIPFGDSAVSSVAVFVQSAPSSASAVSSAVVTPSQGASFSPWVPSTQPTTTVQRSSLSAFIGVAPHPSGFPQQQSSVQQSSQPASAVLNLMNNDLPQGGSAPLDGASVSSASTPSTLPVNTAAPATPDPAQHPAAPEDPVIQNLLQQVKDQQNTNAPSDAQVSSQSTILHSGAPRLPPAGEGTAYVILTVLFAVFMTFLTVAFRYHAHV
ncbi:MAG: hypothetical protein WCG83_02130 [Candidatus Peregrinibacteria bacterium]